MSNEVVFQFGAYALNSITLIVCILFWFRNISLKEEIELINQKYHDATEAGRNAYAMGWEDCSRQKDDEVRRAHEKTARTQRDAEEYGRVLLETLGISNNRMN